MPERIVTARYAESFLQYAKETIGFDQGVQAVLDLKQVLSDSPQFKDFLESPEFGEREKFALIDRIVELEFPKELGHFLKLLIMKGRISSLGDIVEYIRMKYGYGDMVTAVLTSALPMDNDLIRVIKEKLEKRIARRVNLYVTFDAQLLGGFKVAVGNQVFDASVKRQLVELREKATNWRIE